MSRKTYASLPEVHAHIMKQAEAAGLSDIYAMTIVQAILVDVVDQIAEHLECRLELNVPAALSGENEELPAESESN